MILTGLWYLLILRGLDVLVRENSVEGFIEANCIYLIVRETKLQIIRGNRRYSRGAYTQWKVLSKPLSSNTP